VNSCAIISFRLGLSDGVSVVAAVWQRALDSLGWRTYTVAGDGPVDRQIPGLAIDGPETAHETLVAAVTTALDDADVVLVENLLSIPMNLAASRAVAEVIAGRPAVLHHHDPPWQRERYAHITELPPDDPSWRHVTINRLTEQQFAERSIPATTIYNGFEVDPKPGDRARARRAADVADDQRLFVHPVRAIGRKNIPAAVELCERHGAAYWLPGPAEEAYHQELDLILAAASCPVIRTAPGDAGLTVNDLYAAADLVLFPSTWEGFGNPPVEAALHRRPVVVGDYPVAAELRALGFRWPGPDQPEAIESLLADPDEQAVLADHNQSVARTHLSLERMTEKMRSVFEPVGWDS